MIQPLSRLLLLLALLFSPALWAEPVKVLMTTSEGPITLELYPDKAPKTVENFLRYANEGFYNGTIFHRVINGFMIQGGGFGEDFQRKRTHDEIINEADNGLKNKRGTIAMARTSEPHSATAQFFINHEDNEFLDFKNKSFRGWGYTVFGKVIDGMKVVDAIADLPTLIRDQGMRNVPEKAVLIEAVSIITP